MYLSLEEGKRRLECCNSLAISGMPRKRARRGKRKGERKKLTLTLCIGAKEGKVRIKRLRI